MNWEAIGAIGEILGAAAVVATLFYLAVQIRQSKAALESNTRTSKASLSYQAARNRAELNTLLMADPALLDLLDRGAGEVPPSFDPQEKLRFAIANRRMLQYMDADYYLYSSGLLESEYWNIRLEFTKRRLSKPYIAEWWEREKQTSNYSPGFLKAMDNYNLPTAKDGNEDRSGQ